MKKNQRNVYLFWEFSCIDLHKQKYNGNVKSNCGFGRSITFVTTKNYFDRRKDRDDNRRRLMTLQKTCVKVGLGSPKIDILNGYVIELWSKIIHEIIE